ncbi:cystathionine gamma-synthase family protein [Thermococcus sp. M39]|nr:cystathionine gamma-synthase family protein [Thermococcus sp. M39]NJE13099.1 cystathionine gamma-synthase family protein [Thermococcus sp. LS2]
MKPLHTPIYQTVVFRQVGDAELSDRGFDLKYSREENPTVRELEKAIAKLEGGRDALAFNSGMAAISALYLGLLRSGDEVVFPLEGYGTTLQLAQELGKFGVKAKLAYPSAESLIEAITPNTRLVLFEVMTNPTLKVIDAVEVAKAAHEAGALVAIDNTFTTPLLFKAIRHADIVIESLTKYIAGHNDVLGGALIWNGDELSETLWHWRRKLGGIIQPIEAWLIRRGMKTLELRFERQSRTALAIAEFLSEHPRVREVHYPGLSTDPYHELAVRLFERRLFGGVLAFDVGDEHEAKKFLASLRVIFPSPSLGGVESLATYPVKSAALSMTEEQKNILGITPGLIRLSVGLEDEDELIEDLDMALGGG